MEATDPHDAQPDDADALRERVRALEEEIARRDEADAASRSRREKTATFAGEVAVGAVAGSDVKSRARSLWDAWRAYGKSPSAEPFPEEETRELAVSVLARLTRVRLLYVLAALIPSAFILAQTVLLYQQNARFDRQNNLIAFEQTTALRDLLFIPPVDTLGRSIRDYHTIPDSLLYADSLYTWSQPNESSVAQISAFAKKEPDIVMPALRPLLRDRASPVAIGALQVLSQPSMSDVARPFLVVGGRFKGAYLGEADLSDMPLMFADLRNALLFFADLRGSDLRGTDLRGADLSNADLYEANLFGANLSGANLSEADLSGANLSGADLNRADLRGVTMNEMTNVFCVQNASHDFLLVTIKNYASSNDSLRVALEGQHGLDCPDDPEAPPTN